MRSTAQNIHGMSISLVCRIVAVLALLLLAGAVKAIPRLQLYMPDGQYDLCTGTWVSTSQDFEIWVVVARLDQGAVRNPAITIALGQGESPTDGALTITPISPTLGDPVIYNAADFTFGDHSPFPDHEVYPTYQTYYVASPETPEDPFEWFPVQCFIPGCTDPADAHGIIYKLQVVTDYTYIHFDLVGLESQGSSWTQIHGPLDVDAEHRPVYDDPDGDGWPVECDNCPDVYNPSQVDENGDGTGDICCCDRRVGDANGLGGDEPTIGDVSVIIDAKSITGTCDGIIGCLMEADINRSGGCNPTCDDITIGDIASMIDCLFLSSCSLGFYPCLECPEEPVIQ